MLTFASAPDFEGPTDADTDNVYLVQVTVTDSGVPAQSGVQNLQVTVTNVNEAPSITSSGTASVPENQTAVINVQSTDPEGQTEGGGGLTYSKTGGADQALFNLDTNTGVLTFASAPNFESPTDADTNNVYLVQVTVTDSGVPVQSGVQNLQVTVTDVPEAPIAGDDAYATIGNTELRVDLGAGATPNVADATGGPPNLGVLDNDVDSDTGQTNTLVVSAIVGCADVTAPFGDSPTCATANGGTVLMQSNGSFSFFPAAGDAAASDSFQYTVRDTTSLTDTGQATINRFERVWYVDPAAATNGTGVSNSPFNTLSVTAGVGLNGAGGAGDSDSAGDYIFIHAGTLSGNNAIVELEANQHLIGKGFGLSIPVNLNGNGSPTILVTAGAKPLLNGPASSDTVILTTAIPIEIRGLSLQAGNGRDAIELTTAAALTGSSTLTIDSNDFRGAGEESIDVNLNAGTTGTLTLNVTNNAWDIASPPTLNAVDVNRAAGTLRLAFSTNTNLVSANAVGAAVNIAGGAAASTTITGFANNTVHGNTAGSGIVVSNVTFDSDVVTANLQQVSGGNTQIGTSGNPVGLGGLILGYTGDLLFTNLGVYGTNGTGLGVTGSGAFTGAAGTNLVANTNNPAVETTGGPAVSVSNASINLQLEDLRSTNSTSTGVSLDTVTGTFTANQGSGCSATGIAVGTFDICNATGTDFSVNAGNPAVTFNGRIGDDTGTVVSITNTTGGAKSFTGAITDGDDGDGSGVAITGNSGGSVSFSGGLVLSTSANAAFTATGVSAAAGGGSVSVCDENPCNGAADGATVNKLTTTTGTALNATNVTIANSRLEFQSISSNGGGNRGIQLNNTCGAGPVACNVAASVGGLKVKANGGSCTTAATCTGGAIQNKTGSVDGINIDNARDVSLTNMFIDSNGGNGVFGDELTNFTLTTSRVSNNDAANTTGGAAPTGLRFDELYGTSTITSSNITDNHYNNIHWTPSSGTSTLNITSSTIGPNDGTVGNNGILVLADGSATATINVTSCTFNQNRASQFGTSQTGSGLVTANVTNSDFNDGNIDIDLGHSQSGDLNFNIDGNDMVGADSNVINFSAASTSTNNGDVNGKINNNRIGCHAAGDPLPSCAGSTADSGSRDAFGIGIDAIGDVDMVLSITNNRTRHTDFEGIFAESAFDDIDADAETALFDLTLTDNDVGQPDDNSAFPFGSMYGVRVEARHTSTLCLDIAGNNAASVGGVEHFRVRQRNTANFNVERLTDGDGTPNEVITNMPTVETFVVGQNDAGATVDATNQTAGVTGFTERANGFCRNPSN